MQTTGECVNIPDSKVVAVLKDYLNGRAQGANENEINVMASIIAKLFGIPESQLERFVLNVEASDVSFDAKAIGLKNILLHRRDGR